jgi:integrase
MATKQSLPQARERKKKRSLPVGVVARDGKWYVVVRYREGGKRHSAWRKCAKNPTDAKEVRAALKLELKQHGTRSLLHNRDTWQELADYYEENYLIEAEYVDGKKVAGRRSYKVAKYQLNTLRSLIPETQRLREMDYEFLRLLRLRLIKLPVKMMVWPDGKKPGKKSGIKKREVKRQRSMIDVNRHMELLRHMMKVARRRLRWINHDPFADADEPLVTRADEKKRRRVMSFEEEDAILTHAVGPRSHLRLVVIGLVDTLMRGGEFFKLRVRDLGFDPRTVSVQQLNTKTLTARSAPLSSRFARELKLWFESQNLGPDDHVFPFAGQVKKKDKKEKKKAATPRLGVRRAWATAKRLAGVSDLRLRDLRRTGATRLLRRGHPIEEISQILGHTGVNMTYDYIGVDKDTTGRAVEILDAMHSERESVETVH